MKKFIYLSGLCFTTALMSPNSALAMIANAPVHSMQSANIIHINNTDKDVEDAQKFVANIADQGIGFLSNQDLSLEDRKKEFKNLLSKNFDMRTIARFALGRYWRTASPKQQKEYLNLFEDMILNVYARRFNDYSGEKVDIIGARPEGKSDVLVNSKIKPLKGSAIKVDWRVRTKDGSSKVIDIIVEGVSMSLTQRSDFSSVIQRGGGDIETLLEHLRAQK